MLNRTRFLSAGLVLAALIVIGFLLSAPHTRDIPVKKDATAAATPAVPAVTVHDTFKKGVHTLTGSVLAPDACMAADVSAAENDGVIVLAISLPADSGVCLEEPTPVAFSTTITASADLPVTATVNGVLAPITLK